MLRMVIRFNLANIGKKNNNKTRNYPLNMSRSRYGYLLEKLLRIITRMDAVTHLTRTYTI